jgi:hypothetical protein
VASWCVLQGGCDGGCQHGILIVISLLLQEVQVETCKAACQQQHQHTAACMHTHVPAGAMWTAGKQTSNRCAAAADRAWIPTVAAAAGAWVAWAPLLVGGGGAAAVAAVGAAAGAAGAGVAAFSRTVKLSLLVMPTLATVAAASAETYAAV